MIVYTPDQLFNILGSVSCETDLIEIEHYILSNEVAYQWHTIEILKICINDLYNALRK